MSDLITRFQEKGERQAETSSYFVPDELSDRIESLGPAELDELDFGVVRLDDGGKIAAYNRYESELSGLDQASVIGKNFFYDIAPCTNNRLFLGSFQKGVEAGTMKFLFFYTFTYRMKPTYVRVILYKKKAGENWIFVKKM